MFLSIGQTEIQAGQGAQRLLYTVPNSTFIENVSGDNEVVINDISGSLSTLQTLINNTRAANPGSIIVIHLLSNGTYHVNNSAGGLILSSQECLVGSGAAIEAVNSAVTNALVTISAGSTNVSVAGGTYNGEGANIFGIYAPSNSARINIDKATVFNCGQDCIQLNGQGDTAFDSEMTVTRCDVSGSPNHPGISIWNATQAVCVENNCHSNFVGVWLGKCADSTVVNNTCEYNATGIDINSGNENNIANNTCTGNGIGILEADSNTMVASDLLISNTVAGISSTGSGNFFIDNLFTTGNSTNFAGAGSNNYVVAYKGALNAPGQNYFYPPLIDNQHTNAIVNGMGRFDVTNNSTAAIDTVQSQYDSAISSNPGDVIVLHLNGTYTVGANPLTLYSNTCVVLGGEIEINASTSASAAIQVTNPAQANISISGGTIDGGSQTGNNGIYVTGAAMVQVDGMTLQNFGPDNPRVSNSDVIRFVGEGGGKPPYIVTRCVINGGAARGIWSQNEGVRGLYSDNTVSNVNMDGVDCDSGTSGALVKFNNLSGNVRYGVFIEQGATWNCAIGNICNNDLRDLNDYNNTEPGRPVEYNSDICNTCVGGGNGLRTGSSGVEGGSDSTNSLTSHNFFFDNVVQGITSGDGLESETAGTQNYYSQNFLAGNSTEIATSGSESFFNSPDVTGRLDIQVSNIGLDAVVTNGVTAQGAAIILGPIAPSSSGQWSLIPTNNGYCQIVNGNSGLDMSVSGASTSAGAPIVQSPFGTAQNDQWMPVSAGNGLYYLLNRHSNLALDVPGGGGLGRQLDQQPYTGGANQQFYLTDAVAPPPRITGFHMAGTTLTMTATNGAPEGQFILLESSNLLSPLTQWTPVLTNTFDASGNLNISTNIIKLNNSFAFYLLQIP